MTVEVQHTSDRLRRGLWDDTVVGWALGTAALRWPERTALVIGGVRLTFGELAGRAGAVAAQMRDAGVGPGERVLIQLPNSADLVLSVLAAWHLGAVPVPVVPMYRRHEMQHIAALARPRAVVATAEVRGRALAAELDEVLTGLGWDPALRLVPADSAAVPGWTRIATGTADPGDPAPITPDDPVVALFTSGTTSAPKCVLHSSRSLVAEARTYRDGAQLGAADAVLIPAPVAHVGALVAATLLPSVTGGRTVVLPRWDADQAARLGAAERVGLVVGAPVFLAELLDRYDAEPDLWRVPRFHTGAAPTGSTVIRRAAAAGVTAWRAWGMTECPTATMGGPDDPLELRESRDGRIEAGTEVRATGPDGAALPAGEAGELQLRGPKLMLGYLTDDGSAMRATDAEGWFATGDVGTVHADGWVTVSGRIKDVVNRGGETFSAAEIESAISAHPDIAEVAVVGLPDERLGEIVGAVVTVVEGCLWPGRQAMASHLEEHGLARPKFPVEWWVRPDLPRRATGKIRKAELAAKWAASSAGPGAVRP